MFCNADAVFLGQVAGAESFPSENGTLIFTDHTIRLGDVLKSPKGVPGQSVTVSRIGGELRAQGRFGKLVSPNYPPLVTGDDYLLFVNYTPTFKTFVAEQSAGVWKLEGGKLFMVAPARYTDVDVQNAGVEHVQIATEI